MSLTNMVARFTDENIVKAYMDLDNPQQLNIVMLDSDGEEVEYHLSAELPKMHYKIINNSTDYSGTGIAPVLYEPYGINFISYVYTNPGETAELDSLYATNDGSTYACSYNKYGHLSNLTFTNSDFVNCMEYGGFIVILDPTEDASCTVTITDAS